MLRRLFPAALAVLGLIFSANAFASGPSPTGLQGGAGVRGGTDRYVALPGRGDTTVLEAVRVRGGRVDRFLSLPGSWGIPTVTVPGATGGLSADGGILILSPAKPPNAALRKQTTFLVVDRQSLTLRTFVSLKGDFAYDALSPDGRILYLIQHISANDSSRYVVRAYDLERQVLLPQAIADKTQRGWVMAGYPIKRLVGPGGRWVYTLYQRGNGGYPFIHALDTVSRTAHCIGVPWHGSQDGVVGLRLSIRDGGGTLAVDRRDGTRFLAVNTKTFAASQPTAGGSDGASSWIFAAGGAGVAALALFALVLRRGRAQRVRESGALTVHGS